MTEPVAGRPAPSPEFRGSEQGVRRAGPFTISLLRSRSARPDTHPHSHRRGHFVIPLDGGFRSEGHGFVPDKPGGQIVFTPAGWEHSDSMARLHGRFAVVSVEEGAAGLERGVPGHSVAIDCPAILQRAHGVVGLMLSETDLPPHLLEALCIELFGETGGEGEAEPMPAWLKRAYHRLLAGPPFPTVTELALEAGVTPAHFARAFRRSFSCTPLQARLWMQTWRAAGRLRNETTDLAHIAGDEGFADQSHFGRTFRRLFRCTPDAYRRVMNLPH